MIIITTKCLGAIAGMSIAPFCILIHPDNIKDNTINHEKIHWKQQVEMLILPFYILYFLEWLFKGYRNISFELEAYTNETDKHYLKTRSPYNWINYF